MTDISATCPMVTVRGDCVIIDDYERTVIEAYDLDAFVEEVTAARDQLRSQGVKTGWSHDADDQGNCGAI